MGTSRWFYNRAVEHINESFQNKTKCEVWHLLFKEINKNEPEWSKGTPFQIKKMAVKDAFKAYKTSVSLLKKKIINKFRLKHKTKKDPKSSVYIPKSAVSSKGIYHTMLGGVKWKEYINKASFDCRLVKKGDDYYLAVPQQTEIAKVENQDVSDRIVAIDLGVRTFATFYSEGSVGKIGEGVSSRIVQLCLRMDKLISEVSKESKQKRKKSLKRVISRVRNKLFNLIDELHKKTARFLVDNFDIIILPRFEVSRMVIKGEERIRKESVRNMLSLGFYRFREYLRSKCLELGKILLEPSEAYTSKTKSWNGELVPNLGASRWIGKGEEMMDRDINGARGIMLIALERIMEKLSFHLEGAG